MLSKLNLNIASAHVATFGERVVGVFTVTDLLGAKITAATRQAAIKRALLQLFGPAEQSAAKPAKSAAAERAITAPASCRTMVSRHGGRQDRTVDEKQGTGRAARGPC